MPSMEATRITVDEVKQRMDRGEQFTFVDSRNPKAWAEADKKLPNAIRKRKEANTRRCGDGVTGRRTRRRGDAVTGGRGERPLTRLVTKLVISRVSASQCPRVPRLPVHASPRVTL